jgi:uncharacterized membrane protein YhaH (DUF805 family)
LVGVFAGIFSPLIANYGYQQDIGSTQSLIASTVISIINILTAGAIGFKLLMLDVPRIRSIGWSPWIVLLMLIPFLNALLQLLLVLLPADFFVKDDSLEEVLQRVKSKQRR